MTTRAADDRTGVSPTMKLPLSALYWEPGAVSRRKMWVPSRSPTRLPSFFHRGLLLRSSGLIIKRKSNPSSFHVYWSPFLVREESLFLSSRPTFTRADRFYGSGWELFSQIEALSLPLEDLDFIALHGTVTFSCRRHPSFMFPKAPLEPFLLLLQLQRCDQTPEI